MRRDDLLRCLVGQDGGSGDGEERQPLSAPRARWRSGSLKEDDHDTSVVAKRADTR